MLRYPDFNPIAVQLGPLKVHWYGLMYLVAFAVGWWLGRRRAARPGSTWDPEQMGDLLFYCALGAVLGGRIGYTLFYNLPNFLHNPLVLFTIWRGGMSFHGGFLGVLVAVWLYGRRVNKGFWEITDFVAPLVPLGLAAGRIGNFINGELWGGPGHVPWAMTVPCTQPRFYALCFEKLHLPPGTLVTPPLHPSQLYEAGLEGFVLFLIVWFYSARPRPTMAVSGVFALGYGVFRFLVEFVRQPDVQLGYLAFHWVTMGQVLSAPMIVLGVVLLWLAYRRPARGAETVSRG